MDQSLPKSAWERNGFGELRDMLQTILAISVPQCDFGIVQDSTFDFERKRNRVEKYDREKMILTVSAMKKIAEVKSKREKQFYLNRMKSKKQTESEIARKELNEGLDLIVSPVVKMAKKTKASAKSEEAAMETEAV